MQEVEGIRDVTVALPHLVGGQGVISALQQPLTTIERAALRHSADIVKQALTGIHI